MCLLEISSASDETYIISHIIQRNSQIEAIKTILAIASNMLLAAVVLN